MHRLPLEGLLVVAVEQAVAAPLCTARLRDAGARVIKIEREGGDFARGYDSAGGADSSYFAWTNHGKESIVLDITDPGDADVLHRLIERADVFVQNLAPGALEKRGFGAEDLRAQHRSLITCDISGYGTSDAVAGKKAYDLLVQAESGMIAISGGPSELGRIGISIVDIGTGVTAYAAILEALIGRSISDEGAAIAVSLFDVAAEWMTVPYAQHVYGDGGPTRVGLRHPTIAPYGAYETSEGSLTLISIQNEREWHRLCREVIQTPEMADDPRYASNNKRVANRQELEAELGDAVGRIAAEEFRRRLTDASIAFGIVSSLDDLVSHVALRTRVLDSSDGRRALTFPAHPTQPEAVGATRPLAPKVPAIGEHSDAIREEFGL